VRGKRSPVLVEAMAGEARGVKRPGFVCEECGRQFSLVGNLKVHVQTVHNGDRPFSCDLCERRFSRKQNLETHRRVIHENVRPYVCELCDLRFGEKIALTRHTRRHHTDEGQQRQKRKEEALARFLRAAGATFEREPRIGFCCEGNKKFARPDFVLYTTYGTVIIELDEFQHEHYPVECEAARMLDLISQHAKNGLDGGKLHIIRFNPDPFTLGSRKQKVPIAERHARLLWAVAQAPEGDFGITYLFYDAERPCALPPCCSAFPDDLRSITVAP